VRQGTILRVPTLEAEPGSQVQIADVLLISDGDKTTVGSPTVGGAMVVLDVLEHGKGRKVINFKYKAKVRYRRKRGHRQGYTALKVMEILTDGAKPSARVAETSSTRRVAPEAAEPVEAAEAIAEAAVEATAEATAEAAAEATVAAAAEATAAAPVRRRRAAPAPATTEEAPAAAPRRRRAATPDAAEPAKE
jgi:large subunit ribosomal protein L21